MPLEQALHEGRFAGAQHGGFFRDRAWRDDVADFEVAAPVLPDVVGGVIGLAVPGRERAFPGVALHENEALSLGFGSAVLESGIAVVTERRQQVAAGLHYALQLGQPAELTLGV